MNRAIFHRGPDDEGHASNDRVSLAMRRLAIQDVEHGQQPVRDASGSVVMVFNGEIYNFPTIRERLIEEGVELRTRGDAEVLPHVYGRRDLEIRRHEPLGFLDQLDGMYAMAIWDGDLNRLVLVRDRLGEKPLYYRPAGARLYFASEIKSLLEVPAPSPGVDPHALEAYLAWGYVPDDRTLYAGVRKLLPGQALIHEGGEHRVESYWRPPVQEIQVPISEARKRVRVLFDDAVRTRMVADVPVGCFLSGGLDSSLVAAHMVRHATGTVKTFSVGFAGAGDLDERSQARLVAEALGTDHVETECPPPGLQDLVRLTHMADGPLANPAVIPTDLLSQVARRDVKVVLGGEGADEIFAGYGKYFYPWVAGMLPDGMSRGLGGLLAVLPAGRLGRFRNKMVDVLRESSVVSRFERVNAVFDRAARRRLRPATSESVPPLTLTDTFDLDRRIDLSRTGLLRGMMLFDLTGYLPDDNLMKLDRATMSRSLEGRSPFLARDLVEWAFPLAPRTKLDGFRTKGLLRQAFTDILPPAVLARGKHAFDLPLIDWLQGPLQPIVQRLLSPEALQVHGLFLEDGVAPLRQQPLDRTRARQLWTLLAFQMWFFACILDRESSARWLGPLS